jgi:hypothetical protein
VKSTSGHATKAHNSCDGYIALEITYVIYNFSKLVVILYNNFNNILTSVNYS